MDKFKAALPFLLLAFAVALVFANSLDADFIYDDHAFVVNNVEIRSFAPLSKVLFSPETFSQPANNHVYRPLASFTFAVNYAIGGLETRGYHVVNLLFHTLNVFLLLILLRRIGLGAGPSFAGALIFAIHPVHVEAVTWISGRGNVMFLFFFLLAYLLYAGIDTASGPRKIALFGGALAAYAVSLLAKEMALPLPALLFGHDLYFGRVRDRKERLSLLWRYVPFIVVAAAFILLRTQVLGRLEQVSYHGGSAYATFLIMLRALVIYAKLLFVPIGLSLSRHFQPSYSIFEPSVLLGLCFVAVAVGICIFSFRRGPLFSFAIVWFAVAMLPVLNIIPVNAIVADRFLYGPSIGFCILMAGWVAGIPPKADRRGPLIILPSVLLTLCFMLLSVNRNNDFDKPVLLWQKTAKSSPTSFVAFNNLGFEYMKQGRPAEAIEALNKAVALKDDFPQARLNLAKCLAKTGDTEAAIRHYKSAVLLLDRAAEARLELAALLERKRRFGQAIEQYEAALAENPDLLEAHRRLAALYAMRDPRRAIEHYRAVVTLAPGDSEAFYRLGRLYYNENELSSAREFLGKALFLDPENKSSRRLLEEIERNSSSGANF